MKRLARSVVVYCYEDTSTPAHFPTYDVSVEVDGHEVESGRLTGIQLDFGWLYLLNKYLEHRLCQTCPGSTSAKRPASSTRGNQREALPPLKESKAAPGRAARRYS